MKRNLTQTHLEEGVSVLLLITLHSSDQYTHSLKVDDTNPSDHD